MDDPPDPWPPPTESAATAAYDASSYKKAAFFAIMANRTGWTSETYMRSSIQVHGMLHACVLGDSIARELSNQLRSVLSDSSTVRYHEMFMTVPEMLHAKLHIFGTNCSVILVGGLSTHWLVRNHLQKGPDSVALHTARYEQTEAMPYDAHELLFSETLEKLSLLARTRRVPIVMVGSGVVDERTLLSDPAQHHWTEFLPWGLLSRWRNRERTMADEQAERDRMNRLSPTQRTHYFDVGEINLRYPGVRCDGMHFASAFENFECPHKEGKKEGASSAAGCLTAYTVSSTLSSSMSSWDCHGSPAVYDFYLARVLERAGLLRREQRWAWVSSAGSR